MNAIRFERVIIGCGWGHLGIAVFIYVYNSTLLSLFFSFCLNECNLLYLPINRSILPKWHRNRSPPRGSHTSWENASGSEATSNMGFLEARATGCDWW